VTTLGGLLPGRSSLRWRLSLLYLLLLVLTVVVISGVQDVALRQNLIQARAQTFSSDIDAARAAFARIKTSPGDTTLPTRYAQIATAVAGKDVVVAFYSHRLDYLTATGPVVGDAVPEMSEEDLSAAIAHSSSSPVEVTAGGTTYLAMAFAITPNAPGTTGVVELAQPMGPIDSVVSGSILLQLITGGIAVVAVLALGLILSRRAMQPLARLQATATELAHGNLGARSQLPHRRDEVGELGRSFDEMAERIEAAFAAQAASEARVRRFIADASHELRTPVTSLKGFIDVMQRGAGRDAESLEAILPAMSREADRLRVLVIDLLTLARLDADKPPTPEPMSANAAVNRVLDEGAPGMPPEIVRDLEPGEAPVMADPAALNTVLRNLLINACKYAAGASQHWTTRTVGNSVEIIVADAGPGIDEADLPHIFERFYRGEKTRTREEGGSGLGLAIVWSLVTSQGGTVSVESSIGHGTTVTVTLPRP
jgi:two-component system OmpR family sensor kinase